MSDRNAIARELSVEELDAFVTALAAKPGKERTLEAIKRAAAEMGITISIMSAKAFRDTTFERHLEKIRNAQNIALQVEQIEAGGNTMSEASAKVLSKRIFTRLIAAEGEDSAEEIDEEKYSLMISRLRAGDAQKAALVAKLTETEIKLSEFRRREEEREAKTAQARQQLDAVKKTKGLSPEALAQIEEAAALL